MSMKGVEARTCSTVAPICKRLKGTSEGSLKPGAGDLAEAAMDFPLGLSSRIARIAGKRERGTLLAQGPVTITPSQREETSDAHRQPGSRSGAGDGGGAGAGSGQATERERRASASGGQRSGASRGHSGGRQSVHFLHLAGHTEKARALSAANGEGDGGDARLSA